MYGRQGRLARSQGCARTSSMSWICRCCAFRWRLVLRLDRLQGPGAEVTVPAWSGSVRALKHVLYAGMAAEVVYSRVGVSHNLRKHWETSILPMVPAAKHPTAGSSSLPVCFKELRQQDSVSRDKEWVRTMSSARRCRCAGRGVLLRASESVCRRSKMAGQTDVASVFWSRKHGEAAAESSLRALGELKHASPVTATYALGDDWDPQYFDSL